MAKAPQQRAAAPGRVAVAFSGGRDSLALLHATCRAAHTLGLQVVALHVHHGLQPLADAWLRQAQALVARWRRRGWPVSLAFVRLAGAPAPGDSLEAWARAGRHAALARLARDSGCRLLLLAHHRRDQAETVLLQALRGAGPAGLAAMPRLAERAGVVWARPWLAQPRCAIEAYVQRHRLRPQQDPSNDDPRFARNRLRLAVWPALNAAFGDAEQALVAVASQAQQADAALAELAALDLAACTDATGRLAVLAWRQLSPARQRNALQAWWRQRTGRGAPNTLLQRLLSELPGASAPAPTSGRLPSARAQWPPVDGHHAVLADGWLRVQVGDGRAAALPQPLASGPLDLSSPGCHAVPAWGGRFLVAPCAQGGLAAPDLQAATLRPRQGGEQFQIAPRRPARSLKKQYQLLAVPDGTLRQGPLVWRGDRLLYVPGLGTDARAWAPPGTPQWALTWLPDAGGLSASVGVAD
jgi:tRNA(Ile)-lysidine synthase